MSSSNLPSTVLATRWVTLIALFTSHCLGDGETKNYINTVPGYSQLVSCAEHPLSTVVRGMSQGCGENADAITSYTCFCTLSSSYMSSVISKGVSSYCRNSSALQQVSSAIAVFDAYCDLGVEAGLTVDPLPNSATATATATPTASSAIPSQTGAAGATGTASSDASRTTAIAAGVAVPVGTIALAVAAYFVYRAKKARRKPAGGHPEGSDVANMQKDTPGGAVAVHTAQGARGEPHHEVSSDQIPRQEMEDPSYQPPMHGRAILEKDGRPVFAEMDASGSVSNH